MWWLGCAQVGGAGSSEELVAGRLAQEPRIFRPAAEAAAEFTWWLPPGADALVLPIAGGVIVEATNAPLSQWLRDGSPWELSELPVIGARYGDRTAAVIVPWPQYAELVIGERVGVQFKFPVGRAGVTPCEVVAQWCGNDPLAVAQAFRQWRETAADTGAIPRPRSLRQKAVALPVVTNLFGAPHFYLWGPSLFSRHDVDKPKWAATARALREADLASFAGRVVASFSAAERESLAQLATAGWAEDWLILEVASALNDALANPALQSLPAQFPLAATVRTNRDALARALPGLVHDSASWGDGFSLPTLDSLRAAGVDRALLLLSDLYAESPRPEVARRATQLGFLTGPYDSYHSVHDPKASPDATWETAQFDQIAFEQGRVQNRDGSGHGGFKGHGYLFAPAAAWPYVRQRVTSLLGLTPFTAWFVDCDATAECFDDFHPLHPATKVDDLRARRQRLSWLVAAQHLVVGSEGGSVLFADLVHFGHGPQTPYLGHLAPEFKEPGSPSFLGRHWPPDAPASYFKPIPTPRRLVTPYFDPQVRIPLYRAALGDEVIVSHHWNFDSLKLSDTAGQRELLELLYLVPPMYHLNRGTWPQRQDAIVRHFTFWSSLHRRLATAPLTKFEVLSPDRLLQRTTYRLPEGEVTMTVNFSSSPVQGYPPESATVAGPIAVGQKVFQRGGR
jgi:hypothetical protein